MPETPENKKIKYGTTAFRVALGGICAAVCLLLMFSSSFLPALSYTVPMFTGVLMVVMIVETNSRWAFATYCAVSLLSLFVTPNIEASLLFILFMGYYPILHYYLSKRSNKLLTWVIKLAVFNIAIVIYYQLVTVLITSEDMLDGFEFFRKYAIPILWLMAQGCFLTYHWFLTVLIDAYIEWFRKEILRRK